MKPALAVFATLAATQSLAAIRNPRLMEDLAHPPRLEQCMKDLLTGVDVKRFSGPFRAVGPNGEKLRHTARYHVVTQQPTGQRGQLYWDMTTTDTRGWRYFLYETPQGSAVGMHATTLDSTSKLIDPTSQAVRDVVLDACAKHLGSGTTPDAALP